MSQDKFLNRFRIPSARAFWHGYSGGIYFVTVCTAHREHFFGDIIRNAFSVNEMILSPIGAFVHEQLTGIQSHYPYAYIPSFTVMPNHIHALVIIDGRKIPFPKRNASIRCRDVACNVSEPKGCNVSEPKGCNVSEPKGCNVSEPKTCDMQHVAAMQSWLTVVVRGMKSSVTKYANGQQIPFAWQSRFHDHVVRDIDELLAIAEYIESNVVLWNEDEFNGG